jgi:hypothetical protein
LLWATAQSDLTDAVPAQSAWYSILGVPVAVVSNVTAALECVDATYTAFRAAPGAPGSAFVARLNQLGAEDMYLVSDSRG